LYLRIERPLFHSGTLSTKAPALVKIYSRAVARISAETAALLSLNEGDIARISTKAGAMELPVSIDKAADSSTVMLTNNFEGAGAFSLIEYTVDPVTKAPVIEGIEVGIEKG
jgi:predicted molibdopterin-dependent oxidoreductase YjgC